MEDANLLFFNHASTASEADNFHLDSVISSIDASARISGQSAFIIDFDEHRVLYRAERLIYVDESTCDDIKRECANPYWSLASENTLSKLLQIRNNYPMMSELLPIEEYSKHICTIDYPISLKNHELFITQKFTPLVMRQDNITRIGLFTINHSNKRAIECMIIAPNGKRFLYDFAKDGFDEFNLESKLTRTEKAILSRAKMGMTCEEIAANLYLSVHTIKTHRARIFKKLNVTTISEALTVIDNYHL